MSDFGKGYDAGQAGILAAVATAHKVEKLRTARLLAEACLECNNCNCKVCQVVAELLEEGNNESAQATYQV